MTGVLVDTSVWVDHFRQRNDSLMELLERDLVLTHPMVIGELACGTPPDRSRTLALLGYLRSVQQASLRETLAFVETERLFGLGCGLVDVHLLASALLTSGAVLWSWDRRLRALAERFDVAHESPMH